MKRLLLNKFAQCKLTFYKTPSLYLLIGVTISNIFYGFYILHRYKDTDCIRKGLYNNDL